jgi:cell division protein FtsB
MIRTAPALDSNGLPPVPLRPRQSPWLLRALVFFSCVALMDGLFGDRGLAQTIKARQDFRRAIESLARAKRENAALHDEARRLRQDLVTLEAVARKQLGLIRPGEILVILKDRN